MRVILIRITNLILLLLITSVFACTSDTKFDKEKWGSGGGDVNRSFPSPYRKAMLTDLTENHKLKGLTEKQLIDLLGTPDQAEKNVIDYNIEIDYGNDIDPVYSKVLEFICSKNSIVTSFSVKEWKHE